jgi:hypothetical protein
MLTCWHCGNEFHYSVPVELRGRGYTADFFQDSTVCLPCMFCMPNRCKNPDHVN